MQDGYHLCSDAIARFVALKSRHEAAERARGIETPFCSLLTNATAHHRGNVTQRGPAM